MSMIPPSKSPFDPPPTCPKCGHIVTACLMCSLAAVSPAASKARTVDSDSLVNEVENKNERIESPAPGEVRRTLRDYRPQHDDGCPKVNVYARQKNGCRRCFGTGYIPS